MQDRLSNLKEARCYIDRTEMNVVISRWIGLSKFDVEWAAWEIERLRDELKKSYEGDLTQNPNPVKRSG